MTRDDVMHINTLHDNNLQCICSPVGRMDKAPDLQWTKASSILGAIY